MENKNIFSNNSSFDISKLDFNKIVRVMRAFCNFLEEVSPLSDKKQGAENGNS